MDRLLSMILNRVLSRLIRGGIQSGIARASGKPEPVTRAQTGTAEVAYRRGRQLASILRRLR